MNQLRAALYMSAFAATWAAVEVLPGAVLNGYSPFQVVFTRYAVHLLALFALVGFRNPRALVRTRRPLFQWSRSLLMLGMPACFVFGLRSGVDPRAAAMIFWLSPLLVLAGSRLLLGERPPPYAVLANLIATAGILLLFVSRRLPPWRLTLLPLGMALTFSLYVLMTRSLRTESTRTNLFYTAAGVALSLAPFMPKLWITPSPEALLAMVGIGLFGLFGLFALDRAAELAPLSTTAPLLCLQVPFQITLQSFVERSLPRPRILTGIGVVLVAALYLWQRTSRHEPEAKGA